MTIIDSLKALEALLEGIRSTSDDFYRLAERLQETRDAVRDYLDGLPEAERHAVEFQLTPMVTALLNWVHGAVDEALASGAIGKHLAACCKLLAISLNFVTGMTRMMAEDWTTATQRLNQKGG